MVMVKNKKLHGRVRRNTPDSINRKIDRNLIRNIDKYRDSNDNEITRRLEELRKEWDVEKTLEVNASALALTGVVLGALVSKKWLLLPVIVTTFLLQHGLQGWCPPLPLFRAMGIRTRQEIDEETYALKILRGDINLVSSESGSKKILKILRKRR
jgi:hypothetical protein